MEHSIVSTLDGNLPCVVFIKLTTGEEVITEVVRIYGTSLYAKKPHTTTQYRDPSGAIKKGLVPWMLDTMFIELQSIASYGLDIPLDLTHAYTKASTGIETAQVMPR